MSTDRKTPEVLFEENTKLVHFIAMKYKNSVNAPYYEDYIQEGMIGLWKACQTFDESKGATFSTYAGKCITNQILMYFRKACRPIFRHTVSYDVPLRNANGDTVELSELLPDPRSLDEFEAIENRLSISKECLLKLRKNERDVLYRTYFLEQKQLDIAKALGCSQSYVSRLQKSGLRKLKEAVGL